MIESLGLEVCSHGPGLAIQTIDFQCPNGKTLSAISPQWEQFQPFDCRPANIWLRKECSKWSSFKEKPKNWMQQIYNLGYKGVRLSIVVPMRSVICQTAQTMVHIHLSSGP